MAGLPATIPRPSPKVIIAESTANARDAMPFPPLTMARPRGPVFSSFAVFPAATSDWNRATSEFRQPAGDPSAQ